MNLKINHSEILSTILDNNSKKVYLQFPEGLKDQALNICELIETETSAQTIVQIDPCYGACDIPFDKIKSLNVDLILHFGHTSFNFEQVKN